MLAQGWVLPTAGQVQAPPVRAPPLPPRKTTAPRDVFESKIEYDASHFWKDKPEHDANIPEEDKYTIDFSGTGIAAKYEIGAEIGRGATSILFAAKSKEGGKEVAIKVVNAVTAFMVPKAQWKETGKRLADGAGKHVIGVIEEVLEKETLYIVLERVHGPLTTTLFKNDVKWTEKDAARVISQLLRGLRRLHKKGHIHNDLGVGNILATADCQEVFLAGFSKSTTGESTADLPCASHLKPPEVVKKVTHGKGVDLWQLGCVAYLLLSGKWPFHDPNNMKLNVAIQEGKVVFGEEFSAVSEPAKDFIKQLLNVDPAARLRASKAQEHPWLKDAPATALPPTFLVNLGKTLNLTK